jgi:Flp pilus assembly pilin Flp
MEEDSRMNALLRDLLLGENGQDLIEYSLLASLLSVLSILALTQLGATIRVLFVRLGLPFGIFSGA